MNETNQTVTEISIKNMCADRLKKANELYGKLEHLEKSLKMVETDHERFVYLKFIKPDLIDFFKMQIKIYSEKFENS